MQFKKFLSLVLLAGLAGCAALPSSGPTGKQIRQSAIDPESGVSIRLVEVQTGADLPYSTTDTNAIHLPDIAPPPTDRVGPGDVLDIHIYEAGVTLFVGGAGNSAGSPGVQMQTLPPSRVDDEGNIVIPYGGKLHVAGRTVGEVETMVQQALTSLSQNPQVLITLSQAITNSVIISGEVARPGRLVLQTNRETLSDVIALAGGYRGNAKDLTLRVVRGDQNMDLRVNDLTDNPQLDVRAHPGDRLMLINNPRTFSVLGGSGRSEQLPFARTSVSLAEAIATAGGSNPAMGDPAAVFLLRYVKNAQGGEEPVVYHMNMMKTEGYFLAQRFAMQDRDVLYFGNATANQPSKVIQLISQLFLPIITVTSAVQTMQNSRQSP
ncbi:MAG: polysaccharide export protein [Pseudomonadales bacterium]|jgi:polysaccharide export outer membrane protein|nr:polysaccharide export protein [Pseudomonadales bacterium]